VSSTPLLVNRLRTGVDESRQVRAALDPSLTEENGAYFDNCQPNEEACKDYAKNMVREHMFCYVVLHAEKILLGQRREVVVLDQ